MIKTILILIFYFVLAPIVGGLLSGVDRKMTARLQGRVGPPIIQPFWDVLKLFHKETLVVRRSQNFYVIFFLIFIIFTGGLFFVGGDLLLVIFALTLASIFFVLGAFKASSPYSFIGAERELLQIMSYEPAILLNAVGMYMVTKSFNVNHIVAYHTPLIIYLPGIFLAFVYILATKFRKSPFDLSTSHHAHQELVKGITTEFSGPALGLIEIAHWYEIALIVGFISLFFVQNIALGVVGTLAVYFFTIVSDNAFSRAKWQLTLISSWGMAFILGFGNIILLFFSAR